MSTTGHYTRYINKFPGWSDNCDTMHRSIRSPLAGSMGYYQVEHFIGNNHAWCTYDSFDYSGNKAPGSRFTMLVYSYNGNKAIQQVLNYIEKFPVETLIEMILKYRFNNRSYMDYFQYFLDVMK